MGLGLGGGRGDGGGGVWWLGVWKGGGVRAEGGGGDGRNGGWEDAGGVRATRRVGDTRKVENTRGTGMGRV